MTEQNWWPRKSLLALVWLFIVALLFKREASAAGVAYYEPTVREIVRKDCSRCHSGTLRNLTSYDAIKVYADSGMLEAMLRGLMRQFAGPDADVILDWVAAGAPERASGALVTTPISNLGKPAAVISQPEVVSHDASVAMTVTAKQVYYEPTIKNIIHKDCGRCHTGVPRNLMDWDSVRAYVDSGVLETMLRGTMGRFIGQDAQVMFDWIASGAPENSPRGHVNALPPQTATAARIQPVPLGAASIDGVGQCAGQGGKGMLLGPVTYTDPIRAILAKRCLRCHLGPFRGMTTYDQVRQYVDTGLLEVLVKPGGQMHRFAGPDTRILLTWIQNGAPQ